MKVMVLGSGAREHALAWKIAQSPLLTELWCAPGNPGTALVARTVPVDATDPQAVVALSRERRIDLVVVGPEAPLVAGVVDALQSAGINAFGPVAAAAALEGSKAFAKEVMAAAGVPTAAHRTFENAAAAAAAARQGGPIVVKADGLAGGKGVVVAGSAAEAVAAIHSLAPLGAAAQRLVLEEVLEGDEVSVIALCDGDRFVLLPPARDHKRVGDGDVGPNTGGMGAYAPAPSLSSSALDEVGRRVIAPTLAEMKRRGAPFRGALYAGLMLTPNGPRVLEFNCRFGDPETQPLMMQMGEDLLPWLSACGAGKLAPRPIASSPGHSVAVVLAAEGYPQAPRVGDVIEGLDSVQGAQVFHAGTRSEDGSIVTSGGRVLTVCSRGASLAEARERAYSAARAIHFRGMHYRKDIGAA
jgi:phosphoribosylamine---glycine ligase